MEVLEPGAVEAVGEGAGDQGEGYVGRCYAGAVGEEEEGCFAG